MHAYRIDLAYNGKTYDGFQSQLSGNSIQNHVEKALSTFFREPTQIRAASRTDSGVHAQQQVAVFKTHHPFNERRWMRAFNALLPEGIGVLRCSPTEVTFDPIFHALGKAYRYRIWRGDCSNPFMKSYVWDVYLPIDIALLKQEAQKLVGFHDFTSFCNSDSDAKTKTRKLFEIYIEEEGPLINIWVLGNGFLKQMVRIIAGTLVDIATQRPGMLPIEKLLLEKNRCLGGQTAPALGLTLVEVFYDKIPTLSEVVSKQKTGFCLGLQ